MSWFKDYLNFINNSTPSQRTALSNRLSRDLKPVVNAKPRRTTKTETKKRTTSVGAPSAQPLPPVPVARTYEAAINLAREYDREGRSNLANDIRARAEVDFPERHAVVNREAEERFSFVRGVMVGVRSDEPITRTAEHEAIASHETGRQLAERAEVMARERRRENEETRERIRAEANEAVANRGGIAGGTGTEIGEVAMNAIERAKPRRKKRWEI